MAMLTDKTVAAFDLTEIQRGTCVRFRRAEDPAYRNGLVTRATESTLEVLYANIQNNATSYAQLTAVDVSLGVWKLYWTTDFQAVNYMDGAGGGAGA